MTQHQISMGFTALKPGGEIEVMVEVDPMQMADLEIALNRGGVTIPQWLKACLTEALGEQELRPNIAVRMLSRSNWYIFRDSARALVLGVDYD